MFNHKKFSYKSAFFQSAIQKKSAGSFMLGASFFLQALESDSSIFPTNSSFNSLPELVGHTGLYYGPLAAYAYNFIIKKHYFISLSLSAAVHFGVSSTTLANGDISSHSIPVVHLQPRLAMGINKVKWYAGFSLVRDSYFESSGQTGNQYEYSFNSGNIRVFLGRRVNWLSKGQLQ